MSMTGKTLFLGLLLTSASAVYGQQNVPATQAESSEPSEDQAAFSSPHNKAASDAPSISQQHDSASDRQKDETGYSLKGDATSPSDSRPLEDFTTLRVPMGLKFNVDLVEKGEFPEFSKELQRAEWRWWDPIDLWIVRPTGVKNPPVILYLSTFPSNLDRYYNNDYCKFLVKNGFAVVGFVSALTGPRYHDRPMKEWFISELPEALSTTVHDVQFILNYLEQRGDFDMSRVGMVGDGSGASIAIIAAAVDARIKALDLLDPWGDWPDWLAKSPMVPADERTTYLKPEFLKKLENVDPVKWLPQLKTPEVRLSGVQDVKLTPEEARERIEAAAGPSVHLRNYPSAKDYVNQVTSGGRVFDWIKSQLEQSASAQITSPKTNP